MKKFKVTVDGQFYTVVVEEIDQKPASPGGGSAKEGARAAAGAAAGFEPAQEAVPVSEAQKKGPVSEGGARVPSPMPGSIIEVRVQVGDTVQEGDILLILEAMKMENEITAAQAGTVAKVLVTKGDTVNSGDPLLIIA